MVSDLIGLTFLNMGYLGWLAKEDSLSSNGFSPAAFQKGQFVARLGSKILTLYFSRFFDGRKAPHFLPWGGFGPVRIGLDLGGRFRLFF